MPSWTGGDPQEVMYRRDIDRLLQSMQAAKTAAEVSYFSDQVRIVSEQLNQYLQIRNNNLMNYTTRGRTIPLQSNVITNVIYNVCL